MLTKRVDSSVLIFCTCVNILFAMHFIRPGMETRFATMTHFCYFRCSLNLRLRTKGGEVLINLANFIFFRSELNQVLAVKPSKLWGYRSAHFCHREHEERLTCLEVGDDCAAGQGPFGSIQGHGVAGARLEVGKLVFLLVALDKEGVSCHWKITVDSEV